MVEHSSKIFASENKVTTRDSAQPIPHPPKKTISIPRSPEILWRKVKVAYSYSLTSNKSSILTKICFHTKFSNYLSAGRVLRSLSININWLMLNPQHVCYVAVEFCVWCRYAGRAQHAGETGVPWITSALCWAGPRLPSGRPALGADFRDSEWSLWHQGLSPGDQKLPGCITWPKFCGEWDTHLFVFILIAYKSLYKTILQGTLEGRAMPWLTEEMLDGQHQRVDIYLPMPELLTRASCRKDWKKISAKSSLMSSPPPPTNDPIGQGTELNRTDSHWIVRYLAQDCPLRKSRFSLIKQVVLILT